MSAEYVSAKKYERLQRRYNVLAERTAELEKENADLKTAQLRYKELRDEFDSMFSEMQEAIKSANTIKDKYTRAVGEMMLLRKQYASDFSRLLNTME